MPSFSQELVDLIIDELQDDENALINVSLASRAWLRRSRTYLFQEIYLLPPHQRKLNGVKPWSGDDMELHIQTFIDICSHPQSTIPNAGPKHIYLTPNSPRSPRFTNSIPQADRRRHKLAFLKLLSWLSSRPSSSTDRRDDCTNTNPCNAERLLWNARVLTLAEFEPKNGLAHLKTILRLSPFPRVTHLYLDQVDIRSRKAFSDILSSFPSLEYVCAAVWFNQIPIIRRPAVFPASLTHVEIPRWRNQLLDPSALRILEACTTLKYLTLPVHLKKESMITEINRFLDTSISVKNQILQQCKLILHGVLPNEVFPTSWARSIHFQKVPSWTIDAEPEAFLTLAPEDLVLPNVKQILVPYSRQGPDFGQLGQLDELFSDLTRFPGVREVVIYRMGRFSSAMLESSGWDARSRTVREGSEAHIAMEKLAAVFRTMMPKCIKRGIFKVHFTYQRQSNG